jgi:hypothetical protein
VKLNNFNGTDMPKTPRRTNQPYMTQGGSYVIKTSNNNYDDISSRITIENNRNNNNFCINYATCSRVREKND